MTITYITKCNGCGEKVEEWSDSGPFCGWAVVQFYDQDKLNNPQRHDYCPKCWEKMFTALL